MNANITCGFLFHAQMVKNILLYCAKGPQRCSSKPAFHCLVIFVLNKMIFFNIRGDFLFLMQEFDRKEAIWMKKTKIKEKTKLMSCAWTGIQQWDCNKGLGLYMRVNLTPNLQLFLAKFLLLYPIITKRAQFPYISFYLHGRKYSVEICLLDIWYRSP